MATPDQPALILLALMVVIFTSIGIGVGFALSLPSALRRVQRYPKDSARRSFALFLLFMIGAPLGVLVVFFTAGVVLLLVESDVWRMAYVRLSLLLGILILCGLVGVTPFWARNIEDASNVERDNLLTQDGGEDI